MRFKVTDQYLLENYITEGDAKIDKKLKKEIIQWMNKYHKFYQFWRGPEFSDTLNTSFGITIFPENYEKAKIAEEALTTYLHDLGYGTWGSGAQRTEPGVVNLHISYSKDRPKSSAYTYAYNYKYEDLEEGLLDKVKELFGHEPTTAEDWKQCLDKGYISWKDIEKAEKKAEARRQKEYKNNNSNMCYTDYKKINKGL